MDRREALTALAGAAAALAGCNTLSGSGSSSSASPGETVTDGPHSGTETDPELRLFRLDADRSPIRLPESDGEERPTPVHDERFREHVIVDSESKAQRLSVAAAVDAQAVDSFLGATDFDAETIYVETVRTEACFRLDLCYISWHPGRLSTDYSRQTRPYDERCGVDEWVFEVRLIRIPDAVDADRVNGFSSSIGTGSCRRGRPQPAGEPGDRSGATTPASADTVTPSGTNSTDGGDAE